MLTTIRTSVRSRLATSLSTVLIAALVGAALPSFTGIYSSILEASDSSSGLNNAELAFSYPFRVDGVLQETQSPEESSSPYFWLQSGYELIIEEGVGKTLEGELPAHHDKRIQYARTHPSTSDNGFHPQNLFRLFTKAEWKNVSQALTFDLKKAHAMNPENVHPWNGAFLVSRYNRDNFYVAGIRFDGTAVIKKKKDGVYTTLAQQKIYPGTWDVVENPALLPIGESVRMRMDTVDGEGSTVHVTLSLFDESTQSWNVVAEGIDTSSTTNGTVAHSGTLGVLSTYLETEIDDLTVHNLDAATEPSDQTTDEESADDNTSSGDENSDSTNTENTEEPPADTQDTNTQDDGTTADSNDAAGYGLSRNLTLEEAGSMGASSSGDWWVNSGAYFFVSGGVGSTAQGSLPADDKWREIYARANPLDTDNGFHPQNIFRLLTKKTFTDVVQEMEFRINQYHESDSPNRAGHNGVLFFNRYQDGDNLYYTGIRVDGRAVIKKKQNGRYYTIGFAPLYPGSYSRSSNPNLIPEDKWIGLRSVVTNNADGSVRIIVYVDKENNGNWEVAVEATDNGSTYGPAIRSGAHAGVRTDFLDLEFRDYRVEEVN